MLQSDDFGVISEDFVVIISHLSIPHTDLDSDHNGILDKNETIDMESEFVYSSSLFESDPDPEGPHIHNQTFGLPSFYPLMSYGRIYVCQFNCHQTN